jgi:predicted AlkP superfamily phosphohydrolase/phosphomutase
MLGNAEISAYHERAPEGVVFFYGQEINKGKNISGMKLVDIVPTLLNYLGLPVGKDMDGIVNSSIFLNEYKNPVLYISSYEDYDINPPRK